MKTTLFIAIIVATLGWVLATAAIAATPAFAVSECITDTTGHNVCGGSGGGSGQGGGGSGGTFGSTGYAYLCNSNNQCSTQDIRTGGGGGSGQGGGGSGGSGIICTGPNKSPLAAMLNCKNG